MTGEEFETSDFEIQLREKLHVQGLPTIAPRYRIRHLGAFWHHWNLHRRKCDKTGKLLISVFSKKCPYPVWHKDEWVQHADPPGADFDEKKEVFQQMWEFFQRSPLPHKTGAGNQNCEYTDDWWYGKDCYLCHSGVENEDLKYCYRTVGVRDCQFCTFAWDSELCADLINCKNCFEVLYALNCKNCRNSAFLYDCRNCSNCLFCSNLRDKQYCVGNKQLTKEQFQIEKEKWNFASRTIYLQAKKHFAQMMRELAFHRALYIDKCENCVGNFLENNKNCHSCFFVSEFEDCFNCVRGALDVKTSLDIMSTFESELGYCNSLCQDHTYQIRWSYWCNQSRFLDYCGYCFQCEYCFGCSGLVGKKYHIFNKPYSPEEYESLRQKILDHMQKTGEYDSFFPGYFAPNPYQESWSAMYFPLSEEEVQKQGFRPQEHFEKRTSEYLSPKDIPDSSFDISSSEELKGKIFWHEAFEKPFQIQPADIEFCQKLSFPLPHTYYIHRLQENFRWLPFDGTLRTTHCGKCQKEIQTGWPPEYDGRILCEEDYLNVVK